MPRKGKQNQKGGLSDGPSFTDYYIPDEQHVTFAYADELPVNAAGNVYRYQWRVNSPYDPNYTATGAQPVGFDQWATFYQRYRTVWVDHCVYISCNTGNSTLAAALVPTAKDPGSTLYYFDYAGMRRAATGQTASGSPMLKLRLRGWLWDLMGLERVTILGDTDYSSNFTSNPAKELFSNLAVETSGATDSLTIVSVLRMRTILVAPLYLATSLFRPSCGTPGKVTGGTPKPQASTGDARQLLRTARSDDPRQQSRTLCACGCRKEVDDGFFAVQQNP